jgi:uncharacterized protein (TIGR02453 family)
VEIMAAPREYVQFLEELAQNNNRDWFEANKPRYQQLRNDWTELVQQVILALAGNDAALEGLSAERSLFRINRDVRFSKNKAPYKTSLAAFICPQGKATAMPTYYVQIDHTGTLITAAGVHMPDTEIAGRIRRHLAAHPLQAEEILTDPAFVAAFPRGLDAERLKRVPKGFDESLSNIDLIRLKSFTISSEEPTASALSEGDLFEHIVRSLSAATPFVKYLRDALMLGHD